ncbi:hypothetical protein A3A38_03900 [Candidatus Kaiserbacteria bacterium RIFCSPLOWO2_01_FULL_53_17]|uniref:PIN domain-containing protein n=1 Tax=Candidatus Kaiserbacteria bacterium RIFCSPLOWO2_01_FULL_53_17 TaxID=1798511 RepID=A0A1F6EHX7_9BACT|nr:MAG: hypothetical protein A3A38_03900 [Candidatus Kaiserbacteria bacterium RIFCSPLOWO2_01_FULL_53_17]
MQRKSRLFLDTSAILAGLNSPTGAAGVIIAACISGDITPIISPQVIEEAERNISSKFPLLADAWRSFLLIPLRVTKKPTVSQVRKAYALLPTSDAPILASAIAAKPDALVTWNTKHFLRPIVLEAVRFPILTPGDFLARFLKNRLS